MIGHAFFEELTNAYLDDNILLVMDHGARHKSIYLNFQTIECLNLLPYPPEIDLIEQIWHKLEKTLQTSHLRHLKFKIL